MRASQISRRHAQLFQQRARHPIGLFEEREQKMFVRDLAALRLRSEILRRLQRLLHFLGKFLDSHPSRITNAIA